MKYPAFSLLVIVLVASVGVNAQDELSNNANGKSCPRYEIGIIAPSKDTDFKIVVIAPPKNFDQAMVTDPCPEQNQKAPVSQIITPAGTTNQFFNVLPLR